MLNHRNGSLHAALVFCFAALGGLSGQGLAQSEVAPFHALSGALPGLQYAQASSTVMEVQRELNQLGYNAGSADGLMGARTRSAIQAYQRDSNLHVDGQATSSLLSHVRTTARSGAPTAPAPVAAPQSQQIADIQSALRSLGYRVDGPSGVLTDQTRGVIRSYESDHGLLMSGEPSAELLRHMRQRAAAGSPAPAAPAADANTVARIQTELRLRGYPIPTVSGQMDAQTRQAIGEYQQGQGVAVTGEPSAALLAELRAASAETAPVAEYTLAQRAAAQRILNERGFDAGPPDGVLGPRSRIAIRNFQARNKIDPTGELGARTMELLGINIGTAVAEQPEATKDGYQLRVRDNFKDGDYTRNPAWRVVSGNFEVRNGGLRSVINAPSQRSEDVGRRMLNDLLKEQLGVNMGGGEESAAAAHLPTRITQQFRITVALSGTAAANSHLDLGPYQGDRLNHGYRLIYRADQPGMLHLVVADQSGTTVIGSGPFRIDRGGPQKLVWQRHPDGRMTVSRNGRVLIDAVDRKLDTDAAGFSLINAGGDWTLHELIVEDRG
ncbi:MAG: peptidoglycan-binding domain-containing protein [Azoarcus sp.]|nr:peptidoglycan-binding domain-containing protein [Azoarcus sp.]